MKIFFDWIHRKLHPAAVAKYSQVPRRKEEEEDEKMKGSSMVVVEENEALLLNDMLHGILAIGTLGQYEDPFLLDPSYDTPKLEQEEEGEIVLVKEAAPVVKPMQLMNKKKEGQKEKDQKVETTLAKIELKLLREDWPLLREDKEKGERKRMTLADLFAADPMTKEEQGIDKGSKNSGSKQLHEEVKKKKTHDTTIKSCTNSSSNSNNKKINNKLQKLTRRMLKKKIHPESINMAREADVHRSSALVYW